jgi:hypothetical protein
MPRVLVLTANSEASPLVLATEVEEIRTALSGYPNFIVRRENEVRAADFLHLLLDFEPDILHFAGHGGVEQMIMLKDGRGGHAPLLARNFAGILQKLRCVPKLIFLNACYTDEFSQVLGLCVPAVIGAIGRIDDQAAATFARTFYSILARSLSIGETFELAKQNFPVIGGDPELLKIRVSNPSILKQLKFYGRPKLMARFKVNAKQKPIKKSGQFRMELWLDGVEEVDSVTYQVCHETFIGKNALWEVRRDESRDFWTEHFKSYGDVTIRVIAWSKGRGVGVETSLARALRRHYTGKVSSVIADALKHIEDK